MTQASESVCAGHPDKLADQISDAIVDAAMRQNPDARVACETLVAFDSITLAGEITGAELDYEAAVRSVLDRSGYAEWKPSIKTHVHLQSTNIAAAAAIGSATDQGLVFGYATNETPEMMPPALVQAHKIVRYLDESRRAGTPIGGDGKAQVVFGDNAFVSISGTPDGQTITSLDEGIRDIVGHSRVILSLFSKYGPEADTGVTGRKLQVDTYGGVARHGGGCFSGKDPTKTDRCMAYLARSIAVHLVRTGLSWAEVGLAFGFGVRDPLWISVKSPRGDSDSRLEAYVWDKFSFDTRDVIDYFDLSRPQYLNTAVYGHFGRGFSWELDA